MPLITHPARDPENHAEMMRLLAEQRGAIKVSVNVKDEA